MRVYHVHLVERVGVAMLSESQIDAYDGGDAGRPERFRCRCPGKMSESREVH